MWVNKEREKAAEREKKAERENEVAKKAEREIVACRDGYMWPVIK